MARILTIEGLDNLEKESQQLRDMMQIIARTEGKNVRDLTLELWGKEYPELEEHVDQQIKLKYKRR